MNREILFIVLTIFYAGYIAFAVAYGGYIVNSDLVDNLEYQDGTVASVDTQDSILGPISTGAIKKIQNLTIISAVILIPLSLLWLYLLTTLILDLAKGFL